MKKLIFLSFFLVSISILNAQLEKRQKQVWLGELQRSNNAEKAGVVRAYFDRFGDLYPENGTIIPYKDFFDPEHKGNVYQEDDSGSLETYYCNNQEQLNNLAASYGAEVVSDCKLTFKNIQEKINQVYTSLLNNLISNDKTLIVLIHGFNDPNPTGDYQQLRDKINEQYPTSKYIYLEIFWDGLTDNHGAPALAGIWGRAQKNSSNVAIGLRMLLSKIENTTPIRIITHSLGASVGSGALFNTNSKWSSNPEYEEYSKTTPAPNQQDIRLGMIAPAIPGETTFIDFNKRGDKESSPVNININKIIIGFNRNDYAVTKRILRGDNAGMAGATGLGCDCDNELIRSQKSLKILKYTDEQIKKLFVPIEFTVFKEKVSEEHGLYYYILNPQIKLFLKEMLE